MTRKKPYVNLTFVFTFAVCLVFAGGTMDESAAKIKVVYTTAGDVNMLALGQNVVGPQFSKKYPGVSLMTVNTGPGNAGSQRIYEKILAEPGMPGQPMYFVIPKKASNPVEAKKFVEFITSPSIQVKEIVQRFNWYPGIDGSHLKGSIPKDIFDKVYGDVTPEDLANKGRAFPLADYFNAILEGYERWVR